MENIITSLSLYLPTLLAAVAALIIGWLLALIISAAVRGLLRRITLDDRIAAAISGDGTTEPRRINTETWISRAVFWLIMLFTILVFLSLLNLTAVSLPLGLFLNQILGYIPSILGAAVLLFIAWLLATFLRMLVTRLLNASGFIRRLSTDAQVKAQDRVSIGQTIGNIVYWLVFLLFLPAILDALNLQGILAPVQSMVDEILGILPNVLGAILIFAVGWFVARIIRQIVANLLAGIGIDRVTNQAGMENTLGQQRLSDIIATIVYVLVLIPTIIAALNTLNIPAISVPATNMLNSLLNALPAIFGAILLIGIAYFVARLVGRFVAGLLENVGFNRLFSSIGLYRGGDGMRRGAMVFPPVTSAAARAGGEVQLGGVKPSDIVGYLVTIAIILFAVMEAADLLGFEFLATLVSQFIVAASQVLIGLIIFGIGLYLSSLAERVIRNSGASQAYILAPAARAAIIIFSAALALRQMGIAEDIVNLAFGLMLGAVAVAVALAFGLGGRDVAHRQLERWTQNLRGTPMGAGPSSFGREARPADISEPEK